MLCFYRKTVYQAVGVSFQQWKYTLTCVFFLKDNSHGSDTQATNKYPFIWIFGRWVSGLSLVVVVVAWMLQVCAPAGSGMEVRGRRAGAD